MNWVAPSMVVAMLLFPAGEEPRNPWKDKVSETLEKVAHAPTVATYREAFDVTWRADDWQAALKLTDAARDKFPDEPGLRGMIARALWRAGRIDEAEHVADTINAQTRDPVALTTLIQLRLARCEYKPAAKAARRLQELGPSSATELFYILSVRLAEDQLAGLADMLRETAKRVDPENGYPETYLAEVLDGLPEFFAAVGSEPINQVAKHGAAEMPMLTAVRLPYCLATVNGHGPYRLILDTGGSITLSLDADIAREIGLKSLGTASIRGVSGKQDSEQALVDELRIGDIVCRRVMTRWFDLPDVMAIIGDGVVGTGIFSQARMTLDFEHARLVIAPSCDQAAPGSSADLRIVGDAKLVSPIELHGQKALALLDSGADVAAVSPLRLRELFPDRRLTALPAAGLGVGEGESVGISLAPGVELELWGRKYENYSGIALDVLDTLLSPILGVQADVLVGMPVFRDMRSFTVDFPRCRMWVHWIEDSEAGTE
jgi:hypothetical protein